ncbi:hypothetical protein GOBAR_AA24730 [Gossypium barbadense]|uniref:Uncharacterized protein n=1 Tax=Gossypium barbadense TaxID=3634 RepID=A0A2P5WXX2_GOSBA|nr:hypothetical protein GOBAR_AA24730 [Gossypium barbadense]
MVATPSEVSTNRVVSSMTFTLVHRSSSPCFFDDDRHYRIVQSFPSYEIVKHREDKCRHQLRLINDGYGLTENVNGTLPSRREVSL